MRDSPAVGGCVACVAVGVIVAVLMAGCVGVARGGVFKLERFDDAFREVGGSADTLAGSHPYALTTTFVFDHRVLKEENNGFGEVFPSEAETYGEPKDIEESLPQGLLADPDATATRCTEAELREVGGGCPVSSAVGRVVAFDGGKGGFPRSLAALYNMVPPAGVPAQFGANLAAFGIIVHIDGGVRSEGDYGLSASVTNLLKIVSVYAVQAMFWGSPSDASHDTQRAACAESVPQEQAEEHQAWLEEGAPVPVPSSYKFDCPTEAHGTAFLTMPSACLGEALVTGLAVQSWQGGSTQGLAAAPSVKKCGELPFSPSMTVAPGVTTPSAPSGLAIDLHIPQNESVGARGEANLRSAEVKLPEGVTLNPASANGREACSPEEIGLRPEFSSERQALVIDRPAAYTFTIELDGQSTPVLSSDASEAEVQSALEALPGVGRGNAEVKELTGGWEVAFKGTLEARRTQLLSGEVFDNAVQKVTVAGTGGSFKLAFDGRETNGLPYYASDSEVQEELEKLVGAGDVEVAGGPEHNLSDSSVYEVVFTGVLAGKEVSSAITGSSELTGPGSGVSVASPDDHVQNLAIDATGGTFTLAYGGRSTEAIAYDAPASSVQRQLETLLGVGVGDVTVSGGPGGPGAATPYVVTFTATEAEELSVSSALTGAGASATVGTSIPVAPLAVSAVEPGGAVRFTGEAPRCPEASEIGTVEVDTPLLSHPLPGAVYLAAQDNNPFHSLLAVYIVVDDPVTGIVIKLAGHVEANPATGQLTTIFEEDPELPFEDLKLDLFDGQRAPLVTPSTCGIYETSSTLTPWSSPEGAAKKPSSRFAISPCGTPGFTPAFTAGTVNNQADAYSPLVLSLSRSDEEQQFKSLTVTLPPGLLAKLAGVTQCSSASAETGSCPESSRIGTVTVAAGVGSDPVYVSGNVYLTGPYSGGPFGEVAIVPAVAGPFNLGDVIVRGSIRINDATAQASVVSDPFPQFINGEGIPADVRAVYVTLDKSDFTLNPSNCAPTALTGTIISTTGTNTSVSSPFQVANCTNLPFKPSFQASTAGHASKVDGTSLRVTVTSKAGPNGGEANIATVKVDLPKQLPSRLPTLQKACLAPVFEADPASCPSASDVGTATAATPLLAQPLTGPVYLVSHGAAEYPDLEIVLQGEGIELILDGHTKITKGITSSIFRTIPDAPVSTFELSLPAGPYSALGTDIPEDKHYNLCGQNLEMPTRITGQNGAVLKQTTKITITDCPKHKPSKHKHKQNTKKK